MATASARQRALLPALVGAFLGAMLLSVPVHAADPSSEAPSVRLEQRTVRAGEGGAVQGPAGCWLEVAASDEVWGESAIVVPEEPAWVYGEGWGPVLDVYAENPGLGINEYMAAESQPPDVFSYEYRVRAGGYGDWTLTVVDEDAECAYAVSIEVLPLVDVLQSKFLHDIKWLFAERITTGCGNDMFCADGKVTRGQMATFLTRALKLPATSVDYFTDDETNKHESNINRLRAAGITFGCSGSRFCPDGVVTRGQMASFLSRAFKLSPTATDYFTDDETNKHEANINRLRGSGITWGCSGTRFCPDGAVTRGQMAAFIHRAMK